MSDLLGWAVPIILLLVMVGIGISLWKDAEKR